MHIYLLLCIVYICVYIYISNRFLKKTFLTIVNPSLNKIWHDGEAVDWVMLVVDNKKITLLFLQYVRIMEILLLFINWLFCEVQKLTMTYCSTLTAWGVILCDSVMITDIFEILLKLTV